MSLNPDLVRSRAQEIEESVERLEKIAVLSEEEFLGDQDLKDITRKPQRSSSLRPSRRREIRGGRNVKGWSRAACQTGRTRLHAAMDAKDSLALTPFARQIGNRTIGNRQSEIENRRWLFSLTGTSNRLLAP